MADAQWDSRGSERGFPLVPLSLSNLTESCGRIRNSLPEMPLQDGRGVILRQAEPRQAGLQNDQELTVESDSPVHIPALLSVLEQVI